MKENSPVFGEKAPAPTTTVARVSVDREKASEALQKTFWAHDPYAPPESDNARLADISKKFIRLFYQTLLKKKCRVVTGVEIESSFTSEDPNHNLNDTIKYLNAQLIKPGDKTWFEPSKTEEKKGIATKRNGIYRAYNDNGDLEIATWPDMPLETMRYVVAIKKMLVESTTEFQQIAPSHTPSRSAKKIQQIAKTNKLCFGNIKDEHEYYGEHINISLHRTDSEENRNTFDLGKDTMMSGPLAILLLRTLENFTKADDLLLLSSPASVQRAKNRSLIDEKGYTLNHLSTDRSYLDKGRELHDRESDRVEWRVPDSASDIHLTMLTTLASIYAMTKAITQTFRTNEIPREMPVDNFDVFLKLNSIIPMPSYEAKTQADRVQQFQENSAVLKMMRAVVGEAVPKAEQAEYNALIAEFEAAAIRQSNRQFARPNPATEVSRG